MQAHLHASCAIFSIEKDKEKAVRLRTIATITFASPIFSLRAVDPNQSLLLLGLPSSFQLFNWETRQRTVVNMVSEEEEELVSLTSYLVFMP